MTLEVSTDRKQELNTEIQTIKNKDVITKKQLQSLVGKLSFVTNCVRPGRIFLARLLEKLRSQNMKITVDEEMVKDLNWWEAFLPTFEGVSLLWLHDTGHVNSYIGTDACLSGAGGICDNQYYHFKFTAEVLKQTSHITQWSYWH